MLPIYVKATFDDSITRGGGTRVPSLREAQVLATVVP